MLPLILAAASLGGQGYSMYQKNKAQKEADAYQKRLEAEQKKEAKRQALARAISTTYQPRPYEPETSPDLSKYMIRAGLADLFSSAASMGAGELSQAAKLKKAGM